MKTFAVFAGGDGEEIGVIRSKNQKSAEKEAQNKYREKYIGLVITVAETDYWQGLFDGEAEFLDTLQERDL